MRRAGPEARSLTVVIAREHVVVGGHEAERVADEELFPDKVGEDGDPRHVVGVTAKDPLLRNRPGHDIEEPGVLGTVNGAHAARLQIERVARQPRSRNVAQTSHLNLVLNQVEVFNAAR